MSHGKCSNYRSQPQEDRKWKGVNRNIYIPKGNANKKEADTESHFKAMYTAIEESNAGYHFDWDEAHMKGKIVGCLFRLEEWSMNGNTGFSTQAAYFVSADNIRKGKFKLPKDKFLSNGAVSYSEPDDFQETPSSDDDLPF